MKLIKWLSKSYVNWIRSGWNALRNSRWQLVPFKQILMMREKLAESVKSLQVTRWSLREAFATKKLDELLQNGDFTPSVRKPDSCDKFLQHAGHKKLSLQALSHNSRMSRGKAGKLEEQIWRHGFTSENDKRNRVEDLHA